MTPTDIVLHNQSRILEIAFEDGARYRLPFEFLRVYSPSAEVRGHGPGQETLQVGKRNVMITGIEPAGSYAVKLVFDEGGATSSSPAPARCPSGCRNSPWKPAQGSRDSRRW